MSGRAATTVRKVNLGPVYRIPAGEGRVFRVDTFDVAVFRTRSGTVHATQAWCTHLGGPLADGVVGNGKVICPLHGYKFSLRTGEADGHTCAALKTYPVSVNAEGELMLTAGEDPDEAEREKAQRQAGPLAGRTIAVLEARMGDAVSTMFEREGATVFRAPALLEQAIDAGPEVEHWINTLVSGGYDVVVFLTGVGAARVLDEVARLGRLEAVRDALVRTTVVARGPKPLAALNRRGVAATVTVPEPWTTRESIETLRRISLAGLRVALVHYGERSVPLSDAIVTAGASLDELCVYEWQMPPDVTPLEGLVTAVVDGAIDAVVFTSQVQVRHLVAIAARSGRTAELVDALNTRTITASIGPTCSAALVERGVAPHLEPARPKLGPLVERVVTHFAGPRQRATSRE
jgi:uroporphyrinogen-III synthase